jgi:peptidoglycan/xylan/chitin deacetylase (PgdA/CDA1 family)
MNTTVVEGTRRRAQAAVRARLYSSRVGQMVAAKIRPLALGLVYHRVDEPKVDPWGQAVSRRNFAAHMSILRRRYEIVDVASLVADVQARRVRHGTVVVTFDDGYADVLHNAAPLAAAENVPVRLFVTVAPVLAAEHFWWDAVAEPALHARLKRLAPDKRAAELAMATAEVPADRGRPLTVDELKTFAAMPGMSIGGHTLTHPSLASLAADEQRRELQESRTALEKLTAMRIDTVAYPFGKEDDVDATTRALAAEAGYIAAFTSIARPVSSSTDLYAIPRLAVHDWDGRELERRLRMLFGF